MFSVDVDSSRNLVKLVSSGHVQPSELQLGVEKLRSLLNQVERGFHVLADLGDVESMPVEAAPHLGRIMDVCDEHGVDLVVRVQPSQPDRDVGLAILSQFHYSSAVRIVTCETREEAEAKLSAN